MAPAIGEVRDDIVAILQSSLETSSKAAMRSTLQLNAAIAEKYGAAFGVISIPAGKSAPLTDFVHPSMQRFLLQGRQMGQDGQWRDRIIDE